MSHSPPRFRTGPFVVLPMVALAAAMMLGPPMAGAGVEVQPLTNLKVDAARAQRQRIPILIAFFASYCEWCERVDEEFLRPMPLSGEYRDKVIIRKIETDGHTDFTGLDGGPVRPDRFAYRYDAYLTPTLIFVDHHGTELTERMVGLTTPEMYGGYLDQAIEQATERYRHASPPGTQ